MLSTSFSVPSELMDQTRMVPVLEFRVYAKLPSALIAMSKLVLPAGLAATIAPPIGVRMPFWATLKPEIVLEPELDVYTNLPFGVMASQQLAAPSVGTAEPIGLTVALLLTVNDEIVEPSDTPDGPVSDTRTSPRCEKIAENPPGLGSAVEVIAERVPLGRIWNISMVPARRSTTARSRPSGLTAIDAPSRPVAESKVVEFATFFR